MTTPKPASAPPDTLQAIADEMRQFLSGRGNGPPPCVTDWADRIEALAASAQVREAEPTDWKWWNGTGYDYGNRPPVTRHDARPLYSQPPKPAAEPVPVAQAEVELYASWLETVSTFSAITDTLNRRDTQRARRAAAMLRQQAEAIADHARREAELQTQLRHSSIVGQQSFDRAQALEASLAACRADAERYRWLRSAENECNVEIATSDAAGYLLPGYGDELDATIDALRQEAPHAE